MNYYESGVKQNNKLLFNKDKKIFLNILYIYI
jgi:hypothetical protein